MKFKRELNGELNKELNKELKWTNVLIRMYVPYILLLVPCTPTLLNGNVHNCNGHRGRGDARRSLHIPHNRIHSRLRL